MAQTIEAIYEDGILRPLKPLKNLKEHSKVKVTIEAEEKTAHPLAACIGILPDEDAAEMRRIIDEEFERVDLREW
ncbi:antitoxin family protein [Candidatus Acetothermia bacterium]|nr:antitoxin family protein [Candidatus Acetothermia bacterium]